MNRPNTTTALLFLFAFLAFFLASCETTAATSAVVAAVGASAVGMIEAIAPLLTPEQLAKLQATAQSIDGTVQATQSAIGIIADSITAMKGTVGDQIAAQARAMAEAAHQVATLPTREEVLYTNAGTGLAALGASRGLSKIKHAKPPK
jgi:hypothetical protein